MPKCLVVQHVAPECPFAIGAALRSAEVDVDLRRLFAGDDLTGDATDFDGLVVMGGPMSATSDADFRTRRTEVALLAAAVGAGVPTLGVCLGAQLLALASGASVRVGGSGPEIGWGPVELSPERERDPLFFDLPGDLTVLHWHGDTFDLPPGAERLAGNDRYENQAFRVGDSAWGLQFHLEVTEAAVEGFAAAFAAEAALAPGGAEAIREGARSALASLQPARDQVLERFAHLVAARVSR